MRMARKGVTVPDARMLETERIEAETRAMEEILAQLENIEEVKENKDSEESAPV